MVEAHRGDEQALIYSIVRELHLLRLALPTAAYLESVAAQLEATCVHEVDLPDGTTFDGPLFLRHAARLVRLTIIEEAVDEEEVVSALGRAPDTGKV